MKDYYRNKHLLGELTILDLSEIIDIQGDFTIGVNWLPITSVRRLKDERYMGIFMYLSSKEPDAVFPCDSRVSIRGDIAEVRCSPHGVRIRLERVPAIL